MRLKLDGNCGLSCGLFLRAGGEECRGQTNSQGRVGDDGYNEEEFVHQGGVAEFSQEEDSGNGHDARGMGVGEGCEKPEDTSFDETTDSYEKAITKIEFPIAVRGGPAESERSGLHCGDNGDFGGAV